MVVKVYISGISGNKEVKKRQQRVLMILDSKSIKYDVIDITEPGRETDKDFMQNNSKSNGGTVSDPNPRSALPPQLFNDEEYCGDYDQFDLSNEIDTLEQFLKLEVPPEQPPQEDNTEKQNGDVGKESKENSQEREAESNKADEEKEKEKSASREATPAERTSKEPTPAKEDEPQKEASPERQKSVEKDETTEVKEESPAKEVEAKELSKVNTPEKSKENTPEKDNVNENGTVSSRDQSEEKEVEEKAIESKNPSELLIESEQTAAAE